MKQQIINKAIDCVFEIMEDHKKVKAMDDFQATLGFSNNLFSYAEFFEANEYKLVDFLDLFFYELTNSFDPDEDQGGLASYAIYDETAEIVDGSNKYNLKNKEDFHKVVSLMIEKKID